MRLGSVRDLIGIAPVLMDPEAKGPDPVYFVFNGISDQAGGDGKWTNMTVMAAGKLGEEYPKTFGHYHGSKNLETYRVLSGEGILQLQKKFYDQKMWVTEKCSEVWLIKAKAGDELTIDPEFGHNWSNTSNLPLVLIDNWTMGHDPSDYVMIERLQGMAYYLINEEGEVKAKPNPKYKDLPEAKWVDADEFCRIHDLGGD